MNNISVLKRLAPGVSSIALATTFLTALLVSPAAYADPVNVTLQGSTVVSGDATATSVSATLIGAQPGDEIVAIVGQMNTNKAIPAPTATLSGQFNLLTEAHPKNKSTLASTATYISTVQTAGNPVVTSVKSNNMQLWLFRPAAGKTLIAEQGTTSVLGTTYIESVTPSQPVALAGDLVIASTFSAADSEITYLPSPASESPQMNCQIGSGQTGSGALKSCINSPNGSWYTTAPGDQPIFNWTTTVNGFPSSTYWASSVVLLSAF